MNSLISMIMIALATTTVNAGCTLCPGTIEIPNVNAIVVDEKTCRDLAMTAVFSLENDPYCNYLRDLALKPCGCKVETESPTKAPSKSPTITPSTSPTSLISIQPSTGPTTVMERLRCDALRQGNYPEFPLTLTNEINFIYKAELYLDPSSSFESVQTKLQDIASRVVSVSAAGCNNNSRLRRNLRYLDETMMNKINFVEFFEMGEQPTGEIFFFVIQMLRN